MTVLGHWGGNQKVECGEEDQRTLGQGLLKESEKKGRVEELECGQGRSM